VITVTRVNLGARPGCGGDADQREPGARDPAVAGVVRDRALVARHHRHGLAGVQRRAAADGDHAVALVLGQRREPGRHVPCGRIGLDAGEHRRAERPRERGDRAVLGHERIADEQRPAHPQSCGHRAQLAAAPARDRDLRREMQFGRMPHGGGS
jgi:hypothetical protein